MTERDSRPGVEITDAAEKPESRATSQNALAGYIPPGASVQTMPFVELLNLLGYNESEVEHVSICHRVGDGIFLTEVCTSDSVSGRLEKLTTVTNSKVDIWFGVNPVPGPPREGGAEVQPPRFYG